MSKFLLRMSFAAAFMITAAFALSAFAAAPTQQLVYGKSLRLEGGARKCTSVQDPENAENTCLKLERTEQTGAASDETATWLEYNNKKRQNASYAISGRFSIEYRAYVPEGAALRTQIYGVQGGTSCELMSLYMSEQSGFATGDQKLFLPCAANRWYRIKIVADTDKCFAAFYIDGEQMAVRNNLSKMKFSIPQADEMTWFRFQIDRDKFQTYVLLDDLSIRAIGGIGGLADIKSIALVKNGEKAGTLTDGAAALKADVRIGEGAVRLFAAQYNGSALCGVSSVRADSDREYSIPIDVGENVTRLSLFAWDTAQMRPVSEKSFCRQGAALSELGLGEKEDIRSKLQSIIDDMRDGDEIDIGGGEYCISPDIGERYCLSVREKKNIKIKGSGAKIILTNPFSGFMEISDSSSVTVEGITLDYKTLPWEQGEVTAVDSDNMSFTFRPDKPGGVIETETFAQNIASSFIMVRNSENPLLIDFATNEHYLISSFERLGGGLYSFGVSGWSESLLKGGLLNSGAKLIVNARGRSGSSFFVSRSKDTVIKDIQISASGECAVKGAELTGDITVDSLKIVPGEGSWISSNADGVHLRFSRGSAVIQNSVFEGLSDDAVNLYQPPIIAAASDGGTISVTSGAQQLLPGDELLIFDYERGKIKGSVTVSSVNGNEIECSGESVSSGDRLYVKNAMFGGSVIKNNRFANLRRYGLLLKCDGIDVIENTFIKTGSDAVAAVYSPSEGLYLRNARFIGNTAADCGYLRNGRQSTSGTFSIKAQSGAEDMLHSDILFSGNTISGAPVNGFYFENAERVTVDETNVFENAADGAVAVTAKNCGSLTIADNLK